LNTNEIFNSRSEIQKAIESLPQSKALLDEAHEVLARQAKKAVAEAR
jgi:Ni,Fe-hydrogenase III large subunit